MDIPTGVVNISEGKASVKGGQSQSGTVIIDMTTISSLDSAYAADGAKQGTRAMLIGHLTSPDFSTLLPTLPHHSRSPPWKEIPPRET